MSEKLDILVDKYLELQEGKVFQSGIEENTKEVFVNSVKSSLKQQIYDEIKTEVKDAAILEAQQEIEEKAELKRIDEFKKLMMDGFIVAIFVGLFVNQFTEGIGYYKGNVTMNSIWPTVILAILFLLICIGIFGWRFISELIKLLKKGK